VTGRGRVSKRPQQSPRPGGRWHTRLIDCAMRRDEQNGQASAHCRGPRATVTHIPGEPRLKRHKQLLVSTAKINGMGGRPASISLGARCSTTSVSRARRLARVGAKRMWHLPRPTAQGARKKPARLRVMMRPGLEPMAEYLSYPLCCWILQISPPIRHMRLHPSA
jgi:hypothetical protein